MLIYDCEIIKAIQEKYEEKKPGIEYCDGWRDFENMGISVICTYDYRDDSYQVFCQDNLHRFETLVATACPIVGFNNLSFDNRLCTANGITVSDSNSYDILVELWRGAGLEDHFTYSSHAGFSLEAVLQTNFGHGKWGHGASAPVWWQKGDIGRVINYCLSDVRFTKKVLDRIIQRGELKDPRNALKTIKVRRPS